MDTITNTTALSDEWKCMKYGAGPLLSKEWHFVIFLEVIKFTAFFGRRHKQLHESNPIVCMYNSSTEQRLIDFLMAQTKRDEPCQTYIIAIHNQ